MDLRCYRFDSGPTPPTTISAALKVGQAGTAKRESQSVHIVAVTNEPVRLSFLLALLRDGGVEAVVLDAHVSATEGSIGAIPRRIAVPDGDAQAATRILREAGEAS